MKIRRALLVFFAIVAQCAAAHGAELEPVVILESHISDPTHGAGHDTTQDFFGVGATLFIGKHQAFEADFAVGRRGINCPLPSCSFHDVGAHAEMKWYPLRHRKEP